MIFHDWQGHFTLIGADNFSFHRATHDYEKYSYNFITKKRSLTKGNDNIGKEKTTWGKVNIQELKTLKDFIEPFTWEVEKDIYLWCQKGERTTCGLAKAWAVLASPINKNEFVVGLGRKNV